MKKALLFLLLATVYQGCTYSMDNHSTNESLKAIAKKYTEVLGEFGKEHPGDLISMMEAVFTPNLIKVLNGKVVCRSRAELYKQISAAKEGVGLFQVIPVSPFIPSTEENMVAVHYDVPTQKQGSLAVMKYLVCNDQGFITEIREIFNKKDE